MRRLGTKTATLATWETSFTSFTSSTSCTSLTSFASLLLLLVFAPAAFADYAVLRNGQRIHITGHEVDGDTVRLHVAGGRVEIRAADLVRVDVEEIFTPIPVEPPKFPFQDEVAAAAMKYELDEHLILSVIVAESNFNSRAVSRRGAQGLMQLMPATARLLGVDDPFDPAQNIEAGARYLREMLDRHEQNVELALAAYNAGPERVAQYRGIPPFAETRAYVRRVLEEWKKRKPQQG